MNGDYEEALRRALHAAADSIEPSADGLQRIRERISRPMLSFESASAWYTDVAARLRSRAQPLAAGLRAVTDLFRPSAAGHARSRYGWVRPLAAMSVAIFVVAAGGFALTVIPQSAAPSGADSASGSSHLGSGVRGGTPGTPGGSGLDSGASSDSAAGSTSKPSAAASSCSRLGPSRTSSTSPSTSTSPSGSTSPSTSPPAGSTSPSVSTSPSDSTSGTPQPG